MRHTHLEQKTMNETAYRSSQRIIGGDIFHKNSFYYNPNIIHEATNYPRQKAVVDHCCEWRECRANFFSNRDLLRHVQEEHISKLPLKSLNEQVHLTCQWRKCTNNRCYPARYKLLLHLQRCHCIDNNEKVR